MARIAIIGSGISGLGCAHFLHRHHDVTVFESADYAGGHANTVVTPETGTGRDVPIDTGFMVYNRETYPHLCRLFDELKVPVKKTSMSFAVRDDESGLEWSGTSLNHLFAQRKNLFNLRFLKMLMAVNRFNRDAVKALDDPTLREKSLAEFVRAQGYGEDFFNLYLVPMSSAVWSTPPELMLEFPAASLLRFFHNHGFLGLHTQHQWWTVDGGSREYVTRLTAPWRDRIVLNNAATRIVRTGRNIIVMTASGEARSFDQVVLATHADDALRLIVNPTRDETRLLSAFRYQPNTATLHTESAVMPRTKRAWSSWNYQLVRGADGRIEPATHYWMNSLQGVSDREQFFVSINRAGDIAPNKLRRTIAYSHPLFDLAALQAQEELPGLNADASGTTNTYFAGSYFRYGFHEDGFMSAVQLCELLLGRDPWEA
ncbi:NAD(P)/FAD-dependent oxidoreductase [Synoicihabitans lomoniglobus]|uniref:FAD-dependent oxidoreductase n=1 Tax=Synoicihabitans lomoniglobus TaxID=2909285 RepID=A0AAE9ZTF1_9BACT|nr:FAD-dependent oxidoreductase [Opitutaceae bacterium LMO-M01]WED63946.1 FAD-dependent oxidoreductase [Opitutaceae bacterium LMO-M01]